MSCTEDSCTGGMGCCVSVSKQEFYCKPLSQCEMTPTWLIVFLPVFLFIVGIVILIIVCCKVKGKEKNKLQVKHYAYEEIRVKPLEERIATYTTVIDSKMDMKSKNRME